MKVLETAIPTMNLLLMTSSIKAHPLRLPIAKRSPREFVRGPIQRLKRHFMILISLIVL